MQNSTISTRSVIAGRLGIHHVLGAVCDRSKVSLAFTEVSKGAIPTLLPDTNNVATICLDAFDGFAARTDNRERRFDKEAQGSGIGCKQLADSIYLYFAST